MNAIIIARKLNERRQRPNPVLTTGELLASIGSAGMEEALRRNWLVPDYDTGYLMVNMHGGKLAEVAEACKCPECRKSDCTCESVASDEENEPGEDKKPGATKGATSGNSDVRSPTSTKTSTDAYTAGNITVTGGGGDGDTEVHIHQAPDNTKNAVKGRTITPEQKKAEMGESSRRTMPRAMREAWGAPGVGSGSNSDMRGQMPMMPHAPPAAPAAPISPTTPPSKKPQIGSQMAAVELQNGQEKLYPGIVSTVGQDGRYRLNFSGGERPPMDHDYGPEQLRFVEQPNA